MNNRKRIEVDLVKLADGGRLLRLTEPDSGFSLEKRLDPRQPVLRQKQRVLAVFEAALAQSRLATA